MYIYIEKHAPNYNHIERPNENIKHLRYFKTIQMTLINVLFIRLISIIRALTAINALQAE